MTVALRPAPAAQLTLVHHRYPSQATDDESLRQFIGREAWGHHASCSNKMGPASDPMTVVDQWCRVHGLSGLRVADASIMPDVVRANTNVTTMMIAERCADFIKAGQ